MINAAAKNTMMTAAVILQTNRIHAAGTMQKRYAAVLERILQPPANLNTARFRNCLHSRIL